MEMQRNSIGRTKVNQNGKGAEGSSFMSTAPVMPFPTAFPINYMFSPLAPIVCSGFQNPQFLMTSYSPVTFPTASLPKNPVLPAQPALSLNTHQPPGTQLNGRVNTCQPTHPTARQVIVIDSEDELHSNSPNPIYQHHIRQTRVANKIGQEAEDLEQVQARLSSQVGSQECKTKARKNKHCKEPILCQELKNRKEGVNNQGETFKTKPIRKIKKKQFKDFLEEKKDKKSKGRDKKEVIGKKQVTNSFEEEKQASSKDNTTICKKQIPKNSAKSLQLQDNQENHEISEQKEHQKTIRKFLESHGEIRKGKEFQTRIPELSDSRAENYRIWLEQKRKKILTREITFPSF